MCGSVSLCVSLLFSVLMSLLLIAHKLQLELVRSGRVWGGGGYNIWQLIYDSLADVLVQLLVRALRLKSNEQIELPTEHRAKAEQFACVSL